jgi:hypothetical protein
MQLTGASGEAVMPDFIFHENIKHYQKLLDREIEPQKIAILQKLLTEERAKLQAWEAEQKPRAAE